MNQGPVPKIILADLGSEEPVYLRTRGSARSRAHLRSDFLFHVLYVIVSVQLLVIHRVRY